MRLLVFTALIFSSFFGLAQSAEESKLISTLNFTTDLPAGLLGGRSIALFEQGFTNDELQLVQKYFQQTGIDVVNYLDIDYVLAGPDPSATYFNYISTRGTKFLVILQKNAKQFQIIFTEFSGTKGFVDRNKSSWRQIDPSLEELLRTIYRFAIATQKKGNYLINDVPEVGAQLRYFKDEVAQRFSGDVRSFKTAIPRWGNEADDKELEAMVKAKFPQRCELVDPNLTDAELEQKGYRMVLRFVHTRGDVARDILGYDVTQTATSLLTNYFVEGQLKVKTMPSKKMIYKFYFKNTEYGNIFLGNRWDADETWQDALLNHIQSLRYELKF